MRNSNPHLIIPFAKPSGITSFTSLHKVKRALGTKKIGHTGTLDSFADGLLVLLSGKLTKLVPYITDFDKTYQVLFYFGKETDTLDPEGTVITEKPLPSYENFTAALKKFNGTIEQVPPLYSAVKQNGERLSDKIRRGEAVTAKPRIIKIYDITIDTLFFDKETDDTQNENALVSGAILTVRCSKGTYIRSLVRDIAHACNSAAYVYALRRTQIGPFTLENAAGLEVLKPFEACAVNAFGKAPSYTLTNEEVQHAAHPLDKHTATLLQFQIADLQDQYVPAFITGKPIKNNWFAQPDALSDTNPIAVFHKQHCAGFILKAGSSYRYKTVFLENNADYTLD